MIRVRVYRLLGVEPMYHIRQGQLEDAEAIAHIHVESWKSTYKDLIDKQDIDGISVENRITLWETVLKKAVNGQTVLVATDENDQVIGFISGGKERTKEYGYDGEIYAVYLLDEYHRQGVGTNLLSHFVQQMKQSGYESLLVWVLIQNENKKFYERYGASPVQAEEITIGKGTYKEVAYGWSDIHVLSEVLNNKKQSSI